MATEGTTLEAVLRRDRGVVLAGLAAITILAWGYVVYLGRDIATMSTMDMTADMAMPQTQRWGTLELLMLLVMWAVMMVAMMVPSVSPLILMFARANRQKGNSRVVGSATSLLFGYLLVWMGFSIAAAATQWGLHSAALMSSRMVVLSPLLGGTLLVAAGVFQFTPLKRACLMHCRSPMSFLMSEWPGKRGGSLSLGVKHGAYCVGCCWILMSLLLVAGVMNLLWVAVIAAFVLVEKVAPSGELVGRIAGAALIVAGVALVAG